MSEETSKQKKEHAKNTPICRAPPEGKVTGGETLLVPLEKRHTGFPPVVLDGHLSIFIFWQSAGKPLGGVGTVCLIYVFTHSK